jgi:ELWxxDGT repeat protein
MSRFYYRAQDASGKSGLWTTDGTALGTKELVPGAQGANGLAPLNMTAVNGAGVVFSGTDSSAAGNTGLWFSDGTAVGSSELVAGTQGSANLYPTYLTRVNGYVVFQGSDGGGKVGLWVTDGTALGSKEILAGARNYPAPF